MEIGPFECKSVVISEDCKYLTDALLADKLRCASCGNNRFVVEALVEATFVVTGGEVPLVCPEGENKIHITSVVKCSKKTCGCANFTKNN